MPARGRHIDETMLIASKPNSQRLPMAPTVFNREYVNLLDYASAFVEELKSQIAEQLRKAHIRLIYEGEYAIAVMSCDDFSFNGPRAARWGPAC